MKISAFRRRQVEYVARSRARQPERLSESDDTPHFIAVVEEMLIDLLERVEKVEGLLAPAPEHEVERELGRKS
jgi:hypothetical protein